MGAIGSTPALIVGVAAGGAASAAFDPALEVPKQEAWAAAANRLPSIDLIARLVAAGEVAHDDAVGMAGRLGFSPQWFDSYLYLSQTTPGFAEVLRMWRLSAVNPDFDEKTLSGLVDHTLAHEGLDWDYQPFLRALKTAELIGLGDIATAIVRGAVPAPSWVPVAPPTTTDSVPRFPVTDVDPVALANALGFSEDMLKIMTARSGLSLAPILATQALFRGVLSDNDWLLAIAEGDLRTEWADTLREAARQIPTTGQMMEHALRGFETVSSAKTNAKRHGMTGDDAQLVYDNLGRAPGLHAVTTGVARGGTYDGTPQSIPEPYLSAVQRANIRPEWYDIEYANRYTYPSAFVLRSLAQAGDLGDVDAITQVLLEIGWKPSFAKEVATAWLAGNVTGDKHIGKAQTQLWSTTHRSYVAEEIDDATATAALEAAGVDAGSVPAVLALWQQERALTRKQLSPSQIVKALAKGDVNAATGLAWTEPDALAALQARGYSQNDAQDLINIG